MSRQLAKHALETLKCAFRESADKLNSHSISPTLLTPFRELDNLHVYLNRLYFDYVLQAHCVCPC